MPAPGNHALVFVQRTLKEPARAGAVAEHQILADDAVRVREAVGKFRRLREQQQACRLRSVRGQHDGFRALLYLALLAVEIHDAGDAAAVVDRNLAHVAVGADFTFAGLLRQRQHRDGRARSCAHVAAIPRADAAIHARGASHVGARDDRERPGNDGQPQLLGGDVEERTRALQRDRRHRIILRHRRDER